MKKVLRPIAGILFTAFIAGMFLLVISLTFSALGRIFPDNFANQIIGLALFDLAALAWGLAFVYRSSSVFQYGISALGFLVGLFGTIVMVASEVMLSAQNLTTPPEWIGRGMVYGFIIAAVLHLILGYMHAATSPEVDAQIRLGASQAEITSEAIRQAEAELESRRAALGNIIRPRLVADVKRGLNLPLSQSEYDSAPDIIEAQPKDKRGGISTTLWNTLRGKRKKERKPVTTTYEQRTEEAEAPNPFLDLWGGGETHSPIEATEADLIRDIRAGIELFKEEKHGAPALVLVPSVRFRNLKERYVDGLPVLKDSGQAIRVLTADEGAEELQIISETNPTDRQQ